MILSLLVLFVCLKLLEYEMIDIFSKIDVKWSLVAYFAFVAWCKNMQSMKGLILIVPSQYLTFFLLHQCQTNWYYIAYEILGEIWYVYRTRIHAIRVYSYSLKIFNWLQFEEMVDFLCVKLHLSGDLIIRSWIVR